MRTLRIALGVAGIAATAHAQRGGVPLSTFRDSAGITIVESTRQIWAAAMNPRLAPAPDLVIGDRDGERYELHRVRGAARLSDGRIVVMDGSTNQLRFFDSTGTFIKQVGRSGDGPGEFREVGSMQLLAGDTIAVIDRERVSFFTGAGTFITSLSSRSPPIKLSERFVGNVDVIGLDARLMGVFGNPEPRTKGNRWIHHSQMVLVDRTNAITVDFGKLPVMEVEMEERYARSVWLGPVFAFAHDTDKLYVGFGNEFSIKSYSLDGQLRTIIRRPWAPHRITPAEIDLYVTEWGKRWIKTTGAAAEAERKDLRDDPYATFLPAYSQLMVDRAHRLWAREPNVIDAAVAGQLTDMALAPSRWTVFDDRGRLLGAVTLPAFFRPTDIGLDYVIGVAVDDDGVQTVVRYKIR